MNEVKKNNIIGIVLENTSTSTVLVQLLFSSEKNSSLFEGTLVLIKRSFPKADILGRIESISHKNDFFTPGNIWSDARGYNKEIPINFSTRFTLCQVRLLRNLNTNSHVSIPPRPNNKIYLISPEDAVESLFKPIKNKTTIDYGTLFGYYKEKRINIPLLVDSLPLHLGVFGVTGSGKSFNTGVLIEKLINISIPKKSKKICYPIVLIDAHGDYSNYLDEYNNQTEFSDNETLGAAGNVYKFIFPLVFKHRLEVGEPIQKGIEQLAINLNLLEPRDLAELIISFYKGSITDAQLALTGLQRVLYNLKFEERKDINQIFITPEGLRIFKTEMNKKDDQGQDFIHHSTKRVILRALERFLYEIEEKFKLLSEKSLWKGEEFIDEITKNGYFVIIDLSAESAPGADESVKQFIIAYLSSLLFKKFQNYKIYNKKDDQRFLLFMVEEAQIYCPSSSFRSGSNLTQQIFRAIATQGRKFGLSLCLISQRPSFIDQTVLSMMNSFFINRVAYEDVNIVNRITGGLPENLRNKLTTLRTGDLIITGQMNPLPFALLITIPYQDRKVNPGVGEISASESLYMTQNK